MKRWPIFLGLLALAFTVGATQPSKPKRAWEWTDDERVAARFDEAANRERVAAFQASQRKALSSVSAGNAASQHSLLARLFVIEGSRNPELFMRHELLDALLRGFSANQAMATQFRQSLDSELRSEGITDPQAFWVALEKSAHAYLTLQRRIEARGSGRSREDDDALCRERYAALIASERTFGARRFDELLYTVIAPAQRHTQSTTFPDAASRLRREAGGCR
jgi:hypothetical protein